MLTPEGTTNVSQSIAESILELVALFEDGQVHRVAVEVNDLSICLERRASSVNVAPTSADIPSTRPATAHTNASPAADAARAAAPRPSAAKAGAGASVDVESIMMGTAYLRPSPGEVEFVAVGDFVKAGDPLALVEVMKLFQSVLAPCDGQVEEVLIGDGDVVEEGQVLMRLRPVEDAAGKDEKS